MAGGCYFGEYWWWFFGGQLAFRQFFCLFCLEKSTSIQGQKQLFYWFSVKIVLFCYYFLISFKFTQSAFFEKNSHVPDSHIFSDQLSFVIHHWSDFYLHNKHIIIKLKSLKICHYPVFFLYMHTITCSFQAEKLKKFAFFNIFEGGKTGFELSAGKF